MDLTDLRRVKERIGLKITDLGSDTFIARLISRVSAQAERVMNRRALETTYTELLSPNLGQVDFFLPAYPVVSITSVNDDFDRAFGAATLVDPTDYYVDVNTGRLHLDIVSLTPEIGSLQVVWIGGMGTDVADLEANGFSDVVEAVSEQVAFFYQRRNSLGLASEGIAGGTITRFSTGPWLPDVLSILRMRRRLAHA